jgi:hypothetical protein
MIFLRCADIRHCFFTYKLTRRLFIQYLDAMENNRAAPFLSLDTLWKLFHGGDQCFNSLSAHKMFSISSAGDQQVVNCSSYIVLKSGACWEHSHNVHECLNHSKRSDTVFRGHRRPVEDVHYGSAAFLLDAQHVWKSQQCFPQYKMSTAGKNKLSILFGLISRAANSYITKISQLVKSFLHLPRILFPQLMTDQMGDAVEWQIIGVFLSDFIFFSSHVGAFYLIINYHKRFASKSRRCILLLLGLPFLCHKRRIKSRPTGSFRCHPVRIQAKDKVNVDDRSYVVKVLAAVRTRTTLFSILVNYRTFASKIQTLVTDYLSKPDSNVGMNLSVSLNGSEDDGLGLL